VRARLSPSPEWTTTALTLAVAAAIVLWRGLPSLGPVPDEGLYSSDSAIPVLMSNLASGGPLDWLYWGQDRFGSWPFLLARGAGALVGHAWTPHALHVAHLLWFTLALVPWMGLAGRGAPVAGAGFLLLPALSPLLGRVLGDLGTVDGWQLPALLWAWWGLRRATRARRPAGWLALAAAAAALATWTSLVSAPLLLVLALVEGSALGLTAWTRVKLVLPAVVGVLVESAVRISWHAAVRSRGWRDVRTPARLDTGYLLENARQVTAVAWQHGAAPWLLAAFAVAIVAARRPRALEAPERRTILGAALAAATALLIVMAVRQVRENGYYFRYLGVSLELAVLGTSAAAGLGAFQLTGRAWPRLGPGLVRLASLGAVILLAPVARPDARESVLRPVAIEIGARYPGAVLAASYWRTYAIAGLLPPGRVVPVPREGEWNRRPDWVPFLHRGGPVLVGRPDDGGPPAPTVLERGARLVLVDPDVLHVPPFPAQSTGEWLSVYRAPAPAP